MSKISLAPDASGSGIFTIASPGTSTNRTLTLPDDTGTIVTNSGNQAGSFTTLNTSGAVVFNDAGANVDFRVEGDTDANLLFVDASTDRVGIGTNAPQNKLSIRGATQYLSIVNTTPGGVGTESFGGIKFFGFDESNIIGQIDCGNSATADFAGTLRFSTSTSGGSFAERIRILSSGGITFNGDTAAANALDDYEEGTWTPSYGGGITAATYGAERAGVYTKVGRLVNVMFTIMTDSVTRGSGAVTITGLPFTSFDTSGSSPAGSVSNASRFDANPPLYLTVGRSTTNIVFYSSINATGGGVDPVALAPTDLNTGAGNRNIITASVTYFAA